MQPRPNEQRSSIKFATRASEPDSSTVCNWPLISPWTTAGAADTVKNHGIPEDKITAALDAMKAYFALPLEEKMKLDNKTTPNFKGYNAVFSGQHDPLSQKDMHEGFEFGYEDLNGSGHVPEKDSAMAGANVWPESPAGFREALLDYYHAAVNLGRSMFPLFAQALELPEDFFEAKTRNSAALMRVLHYPPQTGPVDDGSVGIGAHTDWQVFTILWQEPGIQALQVLNGDKKWIAAPPIPGTLVINLGDQLERWTNGVFKSTVHRAINRSGVRRYSIPLFFGVDYDVRLEPVASCVSEGRPPKYEVVTAGDYIKQRFEATYKNGGKSY
ncbi:unnamed protein product [Peniophora sp. CBMAI 1063]|nr:unnamed protein product [Peniophora sp. CBMAI 1063]